MKYSYRTIRAWVVAFFVLTALISLFFEAQTSSAYNSTYEMFLRQGSATDYAQSSNDTTPGRSQETTHNIRVMSYNVENLFDTEDDPRTSGDDAFTPEDVYRWTDGKYHRKLYQLASVISEVGKWDYPDVVGLIEIENLEVVRDLSKTDILRQVDYRIAVTRGADPRSIDVALMWNPKTFRQIEAYEIPHYGDLLTYPLRRDPRDKRERSGKGRSSLWVALEERHTGEVFDFIVVHLPSRRGGTNSTSTKREEVNGKLNRVLDLIEAKREVPRIIVMGDFNDSPTNVSVKDSLRSRAINDAHGSFRDKELYNLSSDLEHQGKGSHYFRRRLWLPDQIMVSGNLLDPRSGTRVPDKREVIFSPTFLRRGLAPKRSFRGTRFDYNGYSDHFPVFIDIVTK